ITAALLFLPAVGVVAYPWAKDAVTVADKAKYPDWKTLSPELKNEVSAGTVVTANARDFIYYFGRFPDYYRLVEVQKTATYEPVLIKDFVRFKSAIADHHNVYFVADRWNFHNNAFVDPTMREYVMRTMAPVS